MPDAIGFLVHWKTSEENTSWDFLHESLDGPEHYVKLYTSSLFKDRQRDQKDVRSLLGEIVDTIGCLEGTEGTINPLRVKQVSTTPAKDLVVGFEDPA